MCLLHQRFGLGLRHARQGDLHGHLDAEAVGYGTDSNTALDGDVARKGDLVAPGDKLDGADEARRVAGCEQLLGIGARTAGTTQLARCSEFDVQGAIGGGGAAVTATSGLGMGGVDNFFKRHDAVPLASLVLGEQDAIIVGIAHVGQIWGAAGNGWFAPIVVW